MYTIDYFINKFEAIPEDKWHTGNYCSDIDNSQKCALGHCMTEEIYWTKETSDLTELVKTFTKLEVPDVNDKVSDEYPQDTPKKRILAVLYDIKSQSAVDEAYQILTEPITSHEKNNLPLIDSHGLFILRGQ